jgi:leucyl/phenylalanyl-tRNA--protein transferase
MSELTPELLLHGYSIGIFPMADSRAGDEVFWVDPRRRGVLPLDRFRVSRSLGRAMRRTSFTVSLDRDFAGVVSACADRDETWINDEIEALYAALFRQGHAHSIEIWDGDRLAGGVYGVTLGGAFFGESMFSRRTNGSKMALAALVLHLRDCGFTLFDTQFLTDHLASLGAVEIPRATYHDLLRKALEVPAVFAVPERLGSLQEVAQRMTQTS